MLQVSDHPLPDAFDQAYASADEIFFETDLNASNDPAFQARMVQMLSYRDGQRLSQNLTLDTRIKLAEFLGRRGLNMAVFDTLKPSGLSLTLSVMELQRMGMNPSLGVDTTYHTRALRDKKSISALETPDEQLAFIRALDNQSADKMILYTLNDIEHMAPLLKTMVSAWRTGDLNSLSMAGIEGMQGEFPGVYDALIRRRNQAWMLKIQAMLEDDNTEFVLVGAMHLAGEDGLIHSLSALGYKIEQM